MERVNADVKQSLLGGTSSCAAVFFSNPFDTAKTRLMLQRELIQKGQHVPVVYRHVFHCMYVTQRSEGFGALQKGLLAGLLYNFSMQSIRLGLFSAAIRAVPFDSSAIDVLAGFSAGMIGALITSPLSLVKVRLQTQGSLVGRQTNYSGVFDGLKKVFREEGGIRGAYRGVWASMCRVGVGSAAQLASYKRAKSWVTESELGNLGRVPIIIGSAALSGIVCALAMNPLDLVSTRMYNRSHEYSGVFDVLRRTVKSEGVFALWKGVSAQYSRIVPHTILTILFAEALGFDFDP